MIITAIDTNKEMVHEMQRHGIAAVQGDIVERLPQYDVVVTPGNSFGFMDGGIDWALACALGIEMADRVRGVISGLASKELLVGNAVYVRNYNEGMPDLVYAPTMRVPQDIRGTVNAYLATRAAIRTAKLSTRRAGIKGRPCRVAIPGMGTGVGMLSPQVAAFQMAGGIRDALDRVMLYPRLEGHAARHYSLVKGSAL